MPPARRARTALRFALLLGAASAALPSAATVAGEPAGGVAFEPKTTTFAEALAKAKSAAKPVFVDFFTEW